ncbi:hypothetical protein KUV89_00325 [Marinobacter hydrocarbonoclasticus]|nr:hypothetical protein [Marinobacter nauticus]
MKLTRKATSSVLLLAGLSLVGCAEPAATTTTETPAQEASAAPQLVAGQPNPGSATVVNGQKEQSVKATLETGSSWSRELGGQITLTLTNVGTTAARYTIASGMLADFVLSQGERVYWRYSQEMMFTQALTELELAPGESRTVKARVTGSSLNRLDPGKYTVSAMLNTHPKSAAPVIAPVSIMLK